MNSRCPGRSGFCWGPGPMVTVGVASFETIPGRTPAYGAAPVLARQAVIQTKRYRGQTFSDKSGGLSYLTISTVDLA